MRGVKAGRHLFQTSANGSGMSDRVDATGHAWASRGENIAAGYADIDGGRSCAATGFAPTL